MNHEDLCYTPATGMARLVRTKELSPVALMEAVLERIEALNPGLNAYYVVLAEEAMAQARRAEAAVMRGDPLGPLHGVPFSIKDQVNVKGLPTRWGSHIMADHVATADAPVVERLRAAGGILVGKTIMPEFGWKGCSQSPLTGITHNPWRHGFNAGGSSAGAGVSAAAGLAPLNQGSDGGGSIRMPCAFNGVYGIKPTYGRIPHYPINNNDHASAIGPITRTVADAALMLSVTGGPDDRDHSSLEGPPADYTGELRRDVRGLRVAYSPDLGYLPVDAEVAATVADCVGVFTDLGCHVDEVKLDWEDPKDMVMFFWSAHYAGGIGDYLDEWADRMDPGLVACAREGFSVTARDYVRMRGRKYRYWDQVRPLFERYDILVTPTLSVTAFPAGRVHPEHFPEHPWDWFQWSGFCFPFNLTGLPTATCPAGFSTDGLPVGMQIVGRRFGESTVLQASAAFEEARPWADKRPQV